MKSQFKFVELIIYEKCNGVQKTYRKKIIKASILYEFCCNTTFFGIYTLHNITNS